MATEMAVAVRQPFEMEISPERVERQIGNKQQILTFVNKALKPDVDYGVIPGTGTKPSLLQPGAQKICALMNVYPSQTVDQVDLGNGHREYRVRTELRVIGHDIVVAVGQGSCSTMESKYRYRWSKRRCPECQSEVLIKTKKGQFWCPKDKGGCDGNFKLDDERITGQELGKVENPDIADQYNTCLKMACKRSLVGGTLNLSGGWSEHFTQDLEDMNREEDRKRAAEEDIRLSEYNRVFDMLLDASGARGDELKEKNFSAFLTNNWAEFAKQAGFADPNPTAIPKDKVAMLLEKLIEHTEAALAKRKQATAEQPKPAEQAAEVQPEGDSNAIRLANYRNLLQSKYWTDDDDLITIIQYLDRKWDAACDTLFIDNKNNVNAISKESFEAAVTAFELSVTNDMNRPASSLANEEPAGGKKRK